MGYILAAGAFGLFAMWWFAITYADPGKVLFVAVISTIGLAFFGGWKLRGPQ